MLPTPDGLGEPSVKGLAVDRNTALTVTADGNAEVWGEGYVYFAWANDSPYLTQTVTESPWATLQFPGVRLSWYGPGATFALGSAWYAEPSAIFTVDGNNSPGDQILLIAGNWPPEFLPAGAG